MQALQKSALQVRAPPTAHRPETGPANGPHRTPTSHHPHSPTRTQGKSLKLQQSSVSARSLAGAGVGELNWKGVGTRRLISEPAHQLTARMVLVGSGGAHPRGGGATGAHPTRGGGM